MATWHQNCCCSTPPSCSGCNDTGSDCQGVSSIACYWEVTLEGLTPNEIYCTEVQKCAGSITCMRCDPPGNSNVGYPIKDVNGTYIMPAPFGPGCCDAELLIDLYEDDDWYKCGTATSGPSDTGLYILKSFTDTSADPTYPGPTGHKIVLWIHNESAWGCREEECHWCRPNAFRAVNDTFDCFGRNVFENDITSGEAWENDCGPGLPTYTIPWYYGGKITMRAIDP